MVLLWKLVFHKLWNFSCNMLILTSILQSKNFQSHFILLKTSILHGKKLIQIVSYFGEETRISEKL
jgi:hypothetical protein